MWVRGLGGGGQNRGELVGGVGVVLNINDCGREAASKQISLKR